MCLFFRTKDRTYDLCMLSKYSTAEPILHPKVPFCSTPEKVCQMKYLLCLMPRLRERDAYPISLTKELSGQNSRPHPLLHSCLPQNTENARFSKAKKSSSL